MFGLKIFVRVQTFRRVPPVLPRNFCHPGGMWVRDGKEVRNALPPDAPFLQPHHRSVKKTDKDLVLGEMSFGPKTPFVTLFPSKESILNQARPMLSTWESQGCQQIKPLQSTHPALWLGYQQIMLSLLIMLFDCWMKLLVRQDLSHKGRNLFFSNLPIVFNQRDRG